MIGKLGGQFLMYILNGLWWFGAGGGLTEERAGRGGWQDTETGEVVQGKRGAWKADMGRRRERGRE